MSQEIEIEYKSLLSPKEFHKLITVFKVDQKDFFTQTNVYYDTPDFKLKARGMGLRIRLFQNEAELTLKSPLTDLASGLLETTDKLSLDAAKVLISQEGILSDGAVANFLKTQAVPLNELTVQAELKTKRVEIKLDANHLLVLDESWYHGQHDYELELETHHALEGEQVSHQILNTYNITFKPGQNKIARAIGAKRKA